MADAGVFSAINVCFKFVDFCMKVKDVSLENQVFVRIISRVRDDREEAFRLMRKPVVQRHFEIDPDSRKYVEGTILALNKALQSIGKFVESVRLDEERNGTISLGNRFEWVLRHQAKLGTRQLELDTCHKSLLQAMETMRMMERDPLPPSYIAATNPGDDNEDGDDDIPVPPHRRLQLRKESQEAESLIDLDDTADEEMDIKSLNLGMEEHRVQDGFAPVSEERTQEPYTSSRVTAPPSDTFEQMVSKETGLKSGPSNKQTDRSLLWDVSLPLTKSEWGSDTAARPGWEIYEDELKPLEPSLTSCSVGGTSTDKTQPFQGTNQIGIGELVKPSYPNSNPSSLSPVDTLRASRSCCTLSSERPSALESSSSFRSITPTQSPTPSNIDPILLSSPHSLQNISSTMDASLSSILPETTPPHLTAIAPPANTAGFYSARYHPTPYQQCELPSGLISVSELDPTQSFQGGTDHRQATTEFECSLPELVPTHLPLRPSQVETVHTISKFSIPRKPPNDAGALAMGSSSHNEVRLATSVWPQDVGDQVNEMGTDTMPYDERPALTLEDPIGRSITREEILKRKARQDLIWGTG